MPSIYDFKPAFQGMLRPLVRELARAGVSANQITVLALLLSCLVGGLIAAFPQQHWPPLLAPVVIFLRMALNAIDGMLAREHHMQTALGGFLNELGDVVSDAALYLPFALIPGIAPAPVVIFVVLAVVSEMTGVVAQSLGASRRYDGPMGKSDRAFVFGALGLALGLGIEAGRWVDVLMLVLAALTAVTIFNRMRNALIELGAK
ncbi:MAG: CDP-alcohol phosphatidyltransferase family protein [Betaproteobacteria bacterium]|nr:CDP-alcohol phosphatidyltransferase family protein [Betaproteobacteria bacterium]